MASYSLANNCRNDVQLKFPSFTCLFLYLKCKAHQTDVSLRTIGTFTNFTNAKHNNLEIVYTISSRSEQTFNRAWKSVSWFKMNTVTDNYCNTSYIDSVLWLVESMSHDVCYFYNYAKQRRKD